MTVFLDTNVVLDLLLDNRPGRGDAQQVFALGTFGDIRLIVSTVTFANSAYFLEKAFTSAGARQKIVQLRSLVEVSADTQATVDAAIALSEWTDFEDALQYASAVSASAGLILTRNVDDFALSSILVQSPKNYLASA